MRKLLIISLKLFLIFAGVAAVAARLIYVKHPILFKFPGSARNIGKPINAIVYTNGHLDTGIEVYKTGNYWDGKKTNNKTYLLYIKECDTEGMLKFVYIDLIDKWIGRPVSTNKKDYDFIYGNLLQSDVGYHFVDFKDDMKGYNFDPNLSFTRNEIKFNVPPNQLKYDSVRIELNR